MHCSIIFQQNIPFASLEEKSFSTSFPPITEEDPLNLSSSGRELKKALQTARVVAPKTGVNRPEMVVEGGDGGDGGGGSGREERRNGHLREGVCVCVCVGGCACMRACVRACVHACVRACVRVHPVQWVTFLNI